MRIGSLMLVIYTIVAVLAGAALSFAFGAIVAPGWDPSPAGPGAGTWCGCAMICCCFSCCFLLLIGYIVIGIEYLRDTRPHGKRLRDALAKCAALSIFLTIPWLILEAITRFQWYVTLGFVAIAKPGTFPAFHPSRSSQTGSSATCG